MIHFKLFGIPITVQPFFLLIMAYIGGGYKLISEGYNTPDFINVLVFMIAGFISILVHELGHAMMMQRYGRYPEIVLHGLGGVAMSSGAAFSRKQNLLVTIMGPAAQLVLGGIALIPVLLIPEESFPTAQSYHFIFSLCVVSIFWAIINLIPIYPLDGGQILSNILGGHQQKAVHVIGITIAGSLLILLLVTGYFSLLSLIILGMLIFNNYKALEQYK